MTEALVVHEAQMAMDRPTPRQIINQATDEANALASVIEGQKLYSIIQGKKFVKVEGWQTLACLRGCLPKEVSVEEMPEGRYVATVELVRMSDGTVLTRASSECGGPEDPVWQKRPPNARRSMAITRATGKACRVAFAWVMSLSGFETTPLEEMTEDGRGYAPAPTAGPTHPYAPKSPVVDSAPVWTGKLVKMDSKSGKKANGQPWELFVFHGSDGEKFGTFDTKIKDGLMALDGQFVEIAYEPSPKGGKNIVEYRNVTKEEAPF